MNNVQKRGKIIILCIFIALLSLDLTLIAYEAIQKGFGDTLSSIGRICFSFGIMYAVWIGQRWARWLFVILMFLASGLIVFAIIRMGPHALLVGLCSLMLASACMIAFSGSVSSFLLFQQTRGKTFEPIATAPMRVVKNESN